MPTFDMDAIKRFGMTNQMLEHDLDRIEQQFMIDLGRSHVASMPLDEDYYPQIEQSVRAEAASMAPHYQTFYSLEKTIRGLVSDALVDTHGESWWDTRVPPKIKTDAEFRLQRDIETGTTPRSLEPLDFCTFGELGEIIKANWDAFGGMLTNVKAVEKVLARLNSLRGPIAHCSPLAEDEIVRLGLTVRDWFRLMD
jgi:hypothetical protein